MRPSFRINKESFEFKDISLKTYYELRDILKKEPTRNSEFEVVECLTGCPIKLLKKLPYPDWLLVWEEAGVQIGQLTGDTNAIRPIIDFNGVRYGLPAVEDLTIGEFADLDVIISGGGIENKLHEIAAVLYRPIIKEKGNKLVLEDYDTEGYETRKEIFMDFPVTAIRSANAFFLRYVNSSLKNTAESLLMKAKNTNSTSQEDLDKLSKLILQEPGGDYSIQLQEEMLLILKKLPSSRFAQLSTGLPGKKTNIVSRLWPFKHSKNIA
jgi:hypothetical protein